VDGLDQGRDALKRRVRQDAVAEINDMAGGIDAFQQVFCGRARRLGTAEQDRRIDIALYREPVLITVLQRGQVHAPVAS